KTCAGSVLPSQLVANAQIGQGRVCPNKHITASTVRLEIKAARLEGDHHGVRQHAVVAAAVIINQPIRAERLINHTAVYNQIAGNVLNTAQTQIFYQCTQVFLNQKRIPAAFDQQVTIKDTIVDSAKGIDPGSPLIGRPQQFQTGKRCQGFDC